MPLVTRPWKHQREGIEWIKARQGSMLAFGMGTGKSLTTVVALHELEATMTLILCPVTVMGVWRREFDRHAPREFAVLVLDKGTCRDKALRMAEWIKARTAMGDRRLVVVVNYESAWRDLLGQALLARTWSVLVMDESHRIKSPGGRASRFASDLTKRAQRRIALTGTPMPHSPLDIYAQARAVDPIIFGRSFVAFRSRYAVMGGFEQRQVIGWRNAAELRERYRRMALERRTEDCVELPEVTDQVIEFELGAKAGRIYRALDADLFAKIESGEVTVSNALTQLLRLQQVTSGFLVADEKDKPEIVDDAKARALADLLEDAGDERVVVFCRFRHDLDTVRAAAKELGLTYGEISGRQRDLTPQSTMPDGIAVMGVQIQAGGVGIDLTAASIGIYYSLGFSLGDYEQSRRRLHRPGQGRHVRFYHLIALDTIDAKVMRALEKRQQVIEAVMGQPQPAEAAAA